MSAQDPLCARFYNSIKPYVISANVGYRQDVEIDIRGEDGLIQTAKAHNFEAVESLALPEAITEDNIDEFVEVSRRQGRSCECSNGRLGLTVATDSDGRSLLRTDPHVYDHIIRCLGWNHDMEMCKPDTVSRLRPRAALPEKCACCHGQTVRRSGRSCSPTASSPR